MAEMTGVGRGVFSAPDYVRRIRPYVPGKPIAEVKRELGLSEIAKLASNENPYGPSPLALEAARQAAQEIHLYPDGSAFELRRKLAQRFGVHPDQVVAGNGSTEVMELLCKAFVTDGEEVVVSSHAFALYKIAAQAVNAEVIEVPMVDGRHDLEAMASAVAVARKPRIVFIGNPNNPTGTFVGRESLARYFHAVGPEVLTVVDQAYQEYVEDADYPDALEELADGRNVVILGTFSKIFGLAGLRLGYGIGPAAVVAQIVGVRSPFNTSSVAQAAALAALDDTAHAESSRKRNRRERAFLEEGLSERGLRVLPSVTNFLLVDFPRPAADLFQAFLQQGVIVRPMTGYGLPLSMRVSVGSRSQNEVFLAAVDRLGLAP